MLQDTPPKKSRTIYLGDTASAYVDMLVKAGHFSTPSAVVQHLISAHQANNPRYIRQQIEEMKKNHTHDIALMEHRLMIAEEQNVTVTESTDNSHALIIKKLKEGLGPRTGNKAEQWLTGPDNAELLRQIGRSPLEFLAMIEADGDGEGGKADE